MPSPRAIENVWSYPRPPALQPTPARLRVVWRYPSGQERTIAETRKGYRVLETSHPPTYYFPREDVRGGSLQESSARSTYCEWKGRAKYWDLVGDGDESGAQTLLTKGRIWSYPDPTPGFRSIKDYLCFYCTSRSSSSNVGEWHCYVDDDEATAQEGDFYGSWITPEITGGEKGFKGGAGTWGW